MKRLIIPGALCLLLFAVLSIPKVQLALAYLEEAGWSYAKLYFIRLLIDFLFAWVISLVVWLQLNRRPWVSGLAFCFSTLVVSAFWITSLQNAPRSFRQNAAYVYDFIEAKPLREFRRIQQVRIPKSTPAKPPLQRGEPKSPTESVAKGPEQQIEETFYLIMRALKKGNAKNSSPSGR